MRRTLLLALIAALVVCVPPVLAANATNILGVTICGINYACGVTDGVCPENYDVSLRKCTTADPNCVNDENSSLACFDGSDNDLDGLIDYLGSGPSGPDFTGPGNISNYSRGASCYVCDMTGCQQATGYALPPKGPGCFGAQPALNGSLMYVNGTALSPGNGANLRLDCDAASSSCWCAVCRPGYTFAAGTCVFNPPSIVLGSNPITGPAPLSTTMRANVTFPAGTGPVNIEIDLDGNLLNGYEHQCNGLAASPNSCIAPPIVLPAGTYMRYARVIDARGYINTTNVTITSVGPVTITNFTAVQTQNSSPHQTQIVLSATFSTATAVFQIDTDNNVSNGYEVQSGALAGPSNTFVYNTPVLTTGVYTYNARVVDLLTQTAVAGPMTITVYAPPQITSATAFPAAVVSPGITSLILQGTWGAPGNAIFRIDNDTVVNTWESNSTEVASPGSHSAPANIAAPPNKVFAVQIEDGFGKNVNGTINVPVTANTPASVTSWSITLTQTFGGARSNMNFTIGDAQPGWNATIDWGDGSPLQQVANNTGGPSVFFSELNHTYTAIGNYIINITMLDDGGLASYNQTNATVIGLPCVLGNDTGNATYTNNANECCVQPRDNPKPSSCAAPNASGWMSCYALNTCQPTNQSNVCANLPPAAFTDRDVSQAACLGATGSTCTAYPWAQANNSALMPVTGQCCGDDGSGAGKDNLANPVFSSLGYTVACCSQPNSCYTDQGLNPGCRPYLAAEQCGDGEDDDCNGVADDGVCMTTIYGLVTLNDPNNPGAAAVNAVVSVGPGYNDSTNATGWYNITKLITPATYAMYAGLSGYSVLTMPVTTNYGAVIRQDFALDPRQCSANCSTAQGFCDRTCIGVGACQPNATELPTLYACHPQGQVIGYKKGTPITLSSNGTAVTEALCCIGLPYVRDTPPATVDGNTDTLVKVTRYFSNGLRLVIVTWSS